MQEVGGIVMMFLECWRCLQGVGGVCKVWVGLIGRMFLECRRCLQGVGGVVRKDVP